MYGCFFRNEHYPQIETTLMKFPFSPLESQFPSAFLQTISCCSQKMSKNIFSNKTQIFKLKLVRNYHIISRYLDHVYNLFIILFMNYIYIMRFVSTVISFDNTETPFIPICIIRVYSI